MNQRPLEREISQLMTEKTALEELLNARERVVTDQSKQLEQTFSIIKNHAEQLKNQTRILNSILNSLADGVIVANREGHFLVFNRAAEQMIGKGASSIDPEKWSEVYGCFLPDKKTPYPYELLPMIRAIRGEEVNEEELFICNETRPGGVWLSVNARPLRNDNRYLIGGVVVFRDITVRKEAQLELLRKTVQLARLNAERKQLEFFADAASHDLKEPLQKIVGFAGLLKNHADSLDSRGKHYLESIQKSALTMNALIEGLLDFSKTRQGQEPTEVMDPEEVIREAFSDLELRVIQSRAEIEMTKLPKVRGIRMELRQLFQNLISNAIKFRKEEEPLKIEIFGKALNEHQAAIYVKDNGIGFDPKDTEKIFMAFERLNARQAYSGSGLGLALCQKIALRHRGRIVAESEPGKGSCFQVILPK